MRQFGRTQPYIIGKTLVGFLRQDSPNNHERLHPSRLTPTLPIRLIRNLAANEIEQ